jgi:hypothetical protein
MSPRIFVDIQRKGLASLFDRSPIVANSCNYAIRLVSRDMLHSGHKLAWNSAHSPSKRSVGLVGVQPTDKRQTVSCSFVSVQLFHAEISGQQWMCRMLLRCCKSSHCKAPLDFATASDVL